jgi:hypothetical protein
MKNTHALVLSVAFAGASVLAAAGSVAASPASTGKGTGCYVVDANDAYYLDASCQTHDVTKFDADGNLSFYSYQDAGQLPAGAALPSRAINKTYEQCFNFTIGVVCGTIDETITPSGAYKSSFKSH